MLAFVSSLLSFILIIDHISLLYYAWVWRRKRTNIEPSIPDCHNMWSYKHFLYLVNGCVRIVIRADQIYAIVLWSDSKDEGYWSIWLGGSCSIGCPNANCFCKQHLNSWRIYPFGGLTKMWRTICLICPIIGPSLEYEEICRSSYGIRPFHASVYYLVNPWLIISSYTSPSYPSLFGWFFFLFFFCIGTW